MSTPTPASPPDPDSQPAHPLPSPQPLQPHPPLPPPLPPPAPYPPASGYSPPGGYPGYPGYPGHPGHPGYPEYPGYLVVPPARNGMAVASMVVSIIAAVSLLCSLCVYIFGLVSLAGGVVGLTLGLIARKQISARGESGAGMALTGIIVGAITAGIGLLLVVGLLLLGLGFFAALMESEGVATNP